MITWVTARLIAVLNNRGAAHSLHYAAGFLNQGIIRYFNYHILFIIIIVNARDFG